MESSATPLNKPLNPQLPICSFTYFMASLVMINSFTSSRFTHHVLRQTVYIEFSCIFVQIKPYPTAFPYGNGMVLHFNPQQESSTTKTVHKVVNKGLKTYV